MSSIPVNIPAAIGILERVHSHCLFMRDIIAAHKEPIEGENLKGLAHVFENIMADLECAMSDLDPA